MDKRNGKGARRDTPHPARAKARTRRTHLAKDTTEEKADKRARRSASPKAKAKVKVKAKVRAADNGFGRARGRMEKGLGVHEERQKDGCFAMFHFLVG